MKQPTRYCSECGKELWYNNTTGLCRLHVDILRNRKLQKKCSETSCSTILTDGNESGLCKKHFEKAGLQSGENNPMYGKSIYDTWLADYGKEEADKRLTEWKEKHVVGSRKKWEDAEYRQKVKIGTTGKKRSKEFRQLQSSNAKKQMQDPVQLKIRADAMNNSYAQGLLTATSGGTTFTNVKGYYNGHYYASKCELNRIKFLIESGAKWKRYEVNDFDWKIKYFYEGKEHLYLPDFIIYVDVIIIEEIKSSIKQMREVEKVKATVAAAFLEQFGIKYRVVDSATLPLEFA